MTTVTSADIFAPNIVILDQNRSCAIFGRQVGCTVRCNWINPDQSPLIVLVAVHHNTVTGHSTSWSTIAKIEVSRYHAKLELQDGIPTFEDLSSVNGTYVRLMLYEVLAKTKSARLLQGLDVSVVSALRVQLPPEVNYRKVVGTCILKHGDIITLGPPYFYLNEGGGTSQRNPFIFAFWQGSPKDAVIKRLLDPWEVRPTRTDRSQSFVPPNDHCRAQLDWAETAGSCLSTSDATRGMSALSLANGQQNDFRSTQRGPPPHPQSLPLPCWSSHTDIAQIFNAGHQSTTSSASTVSGNLSTVVQQQEVPANAESVMHSPLSWTESSSSRTIGIGGIDQQLAGMSLVDGTLELHQGFRTPPPVRCQDGDVPTPHVHEAVPQAVANRVEDQAMPLTN